MSRITTSEVLKTPTSFFRPPKFMPVLPPTEASTSESSVVGIFMKCMPRLKVDAAKPPRSVTIPPPRFTIIEWRVALPRCRLSHTLARASRLLYVSPAFIVISVAVERQLNPLRRGQQSDAVFSSHKTKSLSGETLAMDSDICCSRDVDIMTSCFICIVVCYGYGADGSRHSIPASDCILGLSMQK